MGTLLPLPAVGFAICCVRSGICSLQGCQAVDDTSLCSTAGLPWLGCALPLPDEARVPKGWGAAGQVWALEVALCFGTSWFHHLPWKGRRSAAETAAQDAQVPAAASLQGLLGTLWEPSVVGRDQPRPCFGDGSGAAGASLEWDTGGGGRKKGWREAEGNKGERGQGEDERRGSCAGRRALGKEGCKGRGAGAGSGAGGASPTAGATVPCCTPGKPISPSGC